MFFTFNFALYIAEASNLFPELDRERAEMFFNLEDSSRQKPSSLEIFGLPASEFFVDGENGTAVKFKTEGNHGTYWVIKSKSVAECTVVSGVKAGGYRERLIRKTDGIFVLQNVTECPEKPAIEIRSF